MRRNPRDGRDGGREPIAATEESSVAVTAIVAEPWVSVEQAASHLGVKKISVYRWIETRGLPAQKIGKLWKLKLSDVDEWVRARGSALETSTPLPLPAPAILPAPPIDGVAAAPARRDTIGKDCLVLVIDDDELVRESIGDFLTDHGYGVAFASDGVGALEQLATPPHPSVIILDLKMPQLDGWQFRERQLTDDSLAAIPVIVVTATADPRLSGVSAVLRKPLRLPQLARAMDDLFGTSLHRGDSA